MFCNKILTAYSIAALNSALDFTLRELSMLLLPPADSPPLLACTGGVSWSATSSVKIEEMFSPTASGDRRIPLPGLVKALCCCFLNLIIWFDQASCWQFELCVPLSWSLDVGNPFYFIGTQLMQIFASWSTS